MKKLFIGLTVLFLLAGIGWAVLMFVFIDSDGVAEKLTTRLNEATGREVRLDADSATVSFMPSPRIMYTNFAIPGLGAEPPVLQADTLEVVLGWSGLSNGAKPAAIILKNGELNANIDASGVPTWRFTADETQNDLANYFTGIDLRVEDMAMHYRTSGRATGADLEGVTGAFIFSDAGENVSFKGAAANGMGIELQSQSVNLSAANAPTIDVKLALTQGPLSINVAGKLANVTESFHFDGVATLNITDLNTLFGLDDSISATLKAEGALVAVPTAWQWRQVALSSANNTNAPVVEGVLNLGMKSGDKADVTVLGHLSQVNIDYFQSLIGEGNILSDQWRSVLQENNSTIHLIAAKAMLNGTMLQDTTVKASIQNGMVVLDTLESRISKDNSLTASGTLRDFSPLAFKGKAEVKGQSFERFLQFIAPKDSTIPSQGMNRFLLRGNLAYANAQLQLSEMEFAVEDLRATGAIIVKNNVSPPLIESFIRAKSVDMDAWGNVLAVFFPAYGSEVTNISKEDSLYGEVRSSSFVWLQSVPYQWQMDWQFEDFTLWARKGSKARFQLELGPNSGFLRSVDAHYNGAAITGDYGLQFVESGPPSYKLDGAVSYLNLADISPLVARSFTDEEWQKYIDKPIDMPFLSTYQGSAKLKFGTLKVKDYIFQNVTMNISHGDSALEINDATGTLLGGDVAFSLSLTTGAIPAFSTAFSVGQADLAQFSKVSPLLQHGAGVVGVRGDIGGSGVTLRSWLTSASGVIGVVGRDVAFSGFGLATIARAVPVARAVADLERAKQAALASGITRFSDIRGQTTLKNGTLSIPRIVFDSVEAEGDVSGNVDVLENAIDLRMDFTLKTTIENGQGPKSTLLLTGPITTVKKELQTQPLDAYVARKSAERSLRSSP